MNTIIIVITSFSAGLALSFFIFTCGAKAFDNNSWQGSQPQLQQQQRDWQHRQEQQRERLDNQQFYKAPC